MADNDLFVKHVWKVREVGVLGVVIKPDEVKMEKEKVQEVVDQPVPRSVKNVQKFLGLANYYKQFVKDFARIAKPLHEITRNDIQWSQRERQQNIFEELKETFTIELILVILNLDKEIRVETDMSNFAIEEVLLMKCKDEKQRPVAYILKSLNKAKRNYEIHNRKMLVIIWCLKIQRYFLEGTKGQLKI